ncbi:MAG: putative signal transducing protein [Saccharofermentanales bacterium]
MQLILSTSDQMQTRMAENLLKEAGIPCFSKHQGYGGYLKVYMGTSVYGIDTYVNDEDYDRAKEIVDVFLAAVPDESQNLDGQPDGITEPAADEQPVESYSLGKTTIKIIVAIMLIALAAGFVIGLLQFFNGIYRCFPFANLLNDFLADQAI